MDSGTFRGLLTLVLLLMFVGIWLWAWSGSRKHGFEQAAQLPLDDSPDDARHAKARAQHQNRKQHTKREA